MLYQLPNGKIIFLTIEQFLDLTDEDIQYMISVDFGEYNYDDDGTAVNIKLEVQPDYCVLNF